MSVEQQLLAAMMADPEDLELRMVLADWYQEYGDPRGEFIQVQIALDRLPKGHWWREDFETRERDLLAEHRKSWDAPLYRHLNQTAVKGRVHSRRSPVRGWKYRRGFVEHLSVDAATLMNSFDAFLPLGPLRSLRLWNAARVFRRLSRWKQLSRFISLDLRHNNLSDAGLESFLVTADLQKLEDLCLADTGLTDQSADLLIAQDWLPGLKRLVLSRNHFSQSGWQRLLGHFGSIIEHENGTLPWIKRPARAEVHEPEFVSYDDDILYDSGRMDTEGKSQVDGEWVEGYDAYDGFEEFDEDGLKYLGGYTDAERSDRWIGPNREPDFQREFGEEEED